MLGGGGAVGVRSGPFTPMKRSASGEFVPLEHIPLEGNLFRLSLGHYQWGATFSVYSLNGASVMQFEIFW